MAMPGGRDTPRVIVFPPLLFGGALVLGLVLHVRWPLAEPLAFVARLTAAFLLALSVLLAKHAEAALGRVGSPIRPDRPTTAIATDGPFRFSRNPIYLATAGVYAAVSLFVPALWPLLLLPLVLVVLRFGVIAPEERYLEAKFGAAYTDYCRRVRRWF
jgi:protein-S-isoprenylcysteine O-methyltransferase Ste14